MKNTGRISKWLNGELHGQELEAFKKTREYHEYKDIVEVSEKLPQPELDTKKGWQDLEPRLSSTKQPSVRRLNISFISKIAAILVVLVASGVFLWLNQAEVITTGTSETAVLELPDESVVKMNADSRVKYNASNWKQERKIHLEGEAFFQVEKGHTFTVSTDQGAVQVLGTEFNVKDRPGYFEVACYEGAVEVNIDDREIILKKGNSVRLVEGEISEILQIDQVAPTWTYQESSFQSVPLKQVLAELERQFGIEIDHQNVDPNQLFTGSFTHKDKMLALKSIVVPLQLRYEFHSDKKVVLYDD